MFAGHYGPAFAAKALPSPPSMGAAFLAVQLVDVAWAIFILTGVEHARIVPGFLAQSDLDLYDMPWTHSLVAALGRLRYYRRFLDEVRAIEDEAS